MKTINKIVDKARKGLVTLLVPAMLGVSGCSNNKNYLTQKDFENAQWKEFYNGNGRIWSCYANEDISKNQLNWQLYETEVRKRNNNNLTGDILLPDLDGDGRVGK